LNEGRERSVDIHLIFADPDPDPDFAGPGVKRLAELIQVAVVEVCAIAAIAIDLIRNWRGR
jgi:hypothetical protein